MAFSYTRLPGTYSNGKNIKAGTYNCASVTTGTIVTGLKNVLHFEDSIATATPSTVAVISGGSVTITTTSGQTGTWYAVGN